MFKILKPICIGSLENSHHGMVNHLNRITQEPSMVAEDDAISKETEIDKLVALISLSFKKIYKPTNNLRNSSNTSGANQDNTPRIKRGTRDDTDDEPANQELEAHYLYMAQIQKVTPDAADKHPEQPKFVNDIYPNEHNIIIDPLDMSHDREQDDQDDNDDLAKERELLASLIKKLKCEINDSKNRNKLLESSNKILFDKLTSQIEDFKNTNKSLESSNTRFKKANNELSKTNQLMFKDLKKFQAELEKHHDVNYMSTVELECAKAKTGLMSYKTESQKSINKYSYQINDLNQKIYDMKKELVAHQDTISIMSRQKEDKKKFYKTREEKELEKVIALENRIKVLDEIVNKTSQSVQTMNMLNRNCKTSFVKLEFLKKGQRANPRFYDIGCYNDNLALMLAPKSNEMIRLAQDSRSKLKRFFQSLKEEMVVDLKYFNSLENEIESLQSQLVTQRTQILNEIDRISKEYYYADHMNAILELSKSNTMSKSFEALQIHAIDLELALQQCQELINNDKAFKENQSKVFLKEHEQYLEIEDLKGQL
ncbi:hypothetical protein Tco_0601229 [Tanacetum coccineum]